MSYRKLTRDEHFELPGPKRILALDGGGLRGILSLSFLDRIEKILAQRHGNEGEFRLSHYFDLIAGTSTGAIIAASLAKGMSVREITELYLAMGHEVFRRNWFRKGVIRARYDETALSRQLQSTFGKDTTLGSESLKTGLLIMTKRMDTGSPWPLANNPRAKFYTAAPDDDWISNSDYPLWKVVRASTAAPSYFDPERITISEKKGRETVVGDFVDGGVSPFNNPSLQALMYATLDGYQVNWPAGEDRLLLVSVGTGSADPSRKPSRLVAKGALKALLGLMDDSAALVETMLQWMSTSPTARSIDLDLGDLESDLIAPTPLLTYLRYDLTLTPETINPLKPGLPDDRIKSLSAMDEPDNLGILQELGVIAAERQVRDEHFSKTFDLTA